MDGPHANQIHNDLICRSPVRVCTGLGAAEKSHGWVFQHPVKILHGFDADAFHAKRRCRHDGLLRIKRV